MRLGIAIISLLLILNLIIFTPKELTDKLIGGLITIILPVIVVISLNVLGSGLNPSGVKIIFSISFIVALLFGAEIPLSRAGASNIKIGAGLLTDLIVRSDNVFVSAFLTLLGLIAVFDLLIPMLGGGSSD